MTNGRKSTPGGIGNFLRPVIAVAGAIALFLIVKSTFREKAIKQSAIIKEKKIAEIAALPAPAAEAVPEISIPDDPLSYLPPPPPLPGPQNFEDLKFDLGDGEAAGKKASEKKNATSGDWKLSK